MLQDELDHKTRSKIAESPQNKILLVTHSRILQCFSAKGTTKDRFGGNLKTGFADARWFNNCEVLPY